MKNARGFTLIELMIVISIIMILSTMALPSFQDRVIRTQLEEAFELSEIALSAVESYYMETHQLPEDNIKAGLPSPSKIIGNYVTGINIKSGVVHIYLGNRINRLAKGKIVTIRPAVVEGEPVVPITWVYGYASVPDGMMVIGDNESTLPERFWPVRYRY